MTLAAFIALPSEQHQPLTEYWGIYLGRGQRTTGPVFPYHYPAAGGGFYVELHHAAGSLDAVRVHAFATSLPLRTKLGLWRPAVLNEA